MVLQFDKTSTEMNTDRPEASSLGIKAVLAEAECVSLFSLFLSGIRRHRVLFYSGIFRHPGLSLKLSHSMDVQIPMWRFSHLFNTVVS